MTPLVPPAADDPTAATNRRRLGLRLVAGAGLAIAVISGLTLFADARQLSLALRDFAWWLLAPILALTLFNYVLRFAKWEMYLRRLEIPPLPRRTSALVFLAGFSMAITPGKVGELIKAFLLRRLTGVPVGRTSAIIVAERITDGFAMLALAGIGAAQFAYGRTLLGLVFVAALALVLLLRRPRLLASLLGRMAHRPRIGRVIEHGIAFVEASHELLGPRLLGVGVGLGIVSWAGECLAFFLVLHGLGLPASWHLLLVATFVLAVSSIVGAVSMLPGGLGVADASVTGMLLLFVSDDAMTRGVAVAATLLIRFATLWFAVLIGALALALLRREIAAGERESLGKGADNVVGEAV